MTHTAREERMVAASLPQANIISILYEQHAQLRDQFGVVPGLSGEYRRGAFDMLREMLARHEAAEEMVLRPATAALVPTGLARSQNEQEKAVARELAVLEQMDLQSPEFLPRLRLLEDQVQLHFAREEAEEFPLVLAALSADDQERMGRWLMRAMALAPSHPHPMLNGSTVGRMVLGPFAALSDWAHDLLTRARAEEH